MRYSTHQVETRCRPAKALFWRAASGWSTPICCRNAIAEAERLFRSLVELCNDVGLLASNTIRAAKRFLGNFPQAFSHLALINSAYNLTQERKPLEQRAQDEHAPPEELTAAAD